MLTETRTHARLTVDPGDPCLQLQPALWVETSVNVQERRARRARQPSFKCVRFTKEVSAHFQVIKRIPQTICYREQASEDTGAPPVTVESWRDEGVSGMTWRLLRVGSHVAEVPLAPLRGVAGRVKCGCAFWVCCYRNLTCCL